MAYKRKADDRPWIIEQRQKYCLDDEWLPHSIDKPDMAKQLICGLKHYHDFKKMHRDIKPANIMLELVEYRAKGLDRSRWVAKYTDHGMVASTDRMVKERCGSPWYCAPEVLDGKRYNEIADVFSVGVVLLCMWAEYDPNRKGSDWSPSSSFDVQRWMSEEVRQIIAEKCPEKYRILLIGMLLRDPKARWPVDECLDFLLRLDQSQTIDSSSSITSILPWTTEPFTEEQKQESLMRKEEVFKRDGGVKSDDELSVSARTVTQVAPGPLPDDYDVPVTPKLSCPAQLPVTPRQSFAGEDSLPSAACTPVFGDEATVRVVKQVVEPSTSWDFTAIWDWNYLEEESSFETYRSRLPPPRAPTSAFNKPLWKEEKEPEARYCSRKVAQRISSTNNDQENEQREADPTFEPNDPEPMVLSPFAQIVSLTQNKKRRIVNSTQINRRPRRKFDNVKEINLSNERRAYIIR